MLFAKSAIGWRLAEVPVTRRSSVYNPGRAPMILTAGTKLGPYEIQSPLGAGGMGEVYRARDARLDRIVAIKVLPPNLSSDPSLRQRLEREARAISKLSHPHICTLHDIGHQDGIDFLVMEYVEGETLEQRLVRGPLSNQHTLRYAAQIAEALAKAHKQGIVHRDLKPGNVMLTKAGAKLLDFGLAKSAGSPLATDVNQITVDQNRLTSDGQIVGTFQYMAPEQLEGKDADGRTDIFALGELIYEMATGKPPFQAKSRASLIAAILTVDPPSITQLQPMTPPGLDRLVKKCLEKDPDDRWQSVSDLASELQWLAQSGSQASTAVAPGSAAKTSSSKTWLAWTLVLVLAATVTFLSWLAFTTSESTAPVVHFTADLPAQVSLGLGPLAWPVFLLSPDGKILVFVGSEDGITRLYARRFDQWEAAPIRGTENADRPSISPDGQWIAFNAGGMLKKVSSAGGPPVDIVAANGLGASWTVDGQIVYTRSYNEGLWQVSASGGAPKMLTAPDHSKNELGHWWPQVLPDNDTVIFTIFSTPIERSRLVALSLKSGKQKTIIEGGVFGRYLPSGHLVFARGETVFAAPFDLSSLATTAGAVAVLEGVAFFPQNALSQFAISSNGSLVFLPSSAAFSEQKLLAVDRTGKIQTIREKLHVHFGPRLSPDGRRIAMGLRESGHAPDLWVLDLTRGSLSPLTHGPASNFDPIWTPDGKRLLYVSERPVFDIFTKSADGGGREESVLSTSNDKFPNSISPDGKTLVFTTTNNVADADLWTAPLASPQEAKPFLATQFYEGDGAFSPDGRWIAYDSRESGRDEIYVRDFPAGGNRFQVSTDGGFEPVWAKNGKELFYRSGKKLIAVPVKLGADFVPGPPKVLVQGDFALGAETSGYDVSPDGQRFYFIQEEKKSGQPAKVNIILNWPEEIKRLLSAEKKR
jgi:serine/threonine protein kinase/Tol biopolymer transport system component